MASSNGTTPLSTLTTVPVLSTLSPSGSTPEPTTADFIVSASVVLSGVFVVMVALIVCCKRFVVYSSKQSVTNRKLREKLEDKNIASRVEEAMLRHEREREELKIKEKQMREVTGASSSEISGSGAVRGVTVGEDGDDLDGEQDIGYARFCDAPQLHEHPSTILEPVETARVYVQPPKLSSDDHRNGEFLSRSQATAPSKYIPATIRAQKVTPVAVEEQRLLEDALALGMKTNDHDFGFGRRPNVSFGPQKSQHALHLPWAKLQEQQAITMPSNPLLPGFSDTTPWNASSSPERRPAQCHESRSNSLCCTDSRWHLQMHPSSPKVTGAGQDQSNLPTVEVLVDAALLPPAASFPSGTAPPDIR